MQNLGPRYAVGRSAVERGPAAQKSELSMGSESTGALWGCMVPLPAVSRLHPALTFRYSAAPVLPSLAAALESRFSGLQPRKEA